MGGVNSGNEVEDSGFPSSVGAYQAKNLPLDNIEI